jgi:hypothetical protein
VRQAILQDVARRTLTSGLAHKDESARVAEDRDNDRASDDPSFASRISRSVRDDVVDLAARHADVLQLPVIQGAQIRAQPLAFAPLLKIFTISAEQAEEAPLRSGRPGKGRCAEGRGHSSASLTKRSLRLFGFRHGTSGLRARTKRH